MGKISTIIFNYPPIESTKPKISAFIFQDAVYIITTQAFLFGKIGKTFAIVSTYPFVSTDPKIANFIFQHTQNRITDQTFLCCKIGKTAAIVFTHPPTTGTEPNIASFIFHDAAYSFFYG